VEWDEEVQEAAMREFREETGLDVSLQQILAVHSNFHDSLQHTVGVWFQGSIQAGVPTPDDDLDALAYFPLSTPPPLAFPTDKLVIARLYEDQK
jgi:ADP-ribose pyrophosphatase YjhB (NUDIX family)